MNKEELTKEELLKAYDLVFTKIHSEGFKISEMKDLLFEIDYYFITKPKDGWMDNLKNFLIEIGFDLSKTTLP